MKRKLQSGISAHLLDYLEKHPEPSVHPIRSRVRVLRNGKVLFNGSEKAFSIWRESHWIRHDDSIERAEAFGPRRYG